MIDVRKRAFAVYASGERYSAYRRNVVAALAKYVPDVDIVDIDVSKCGKLFGRIPEQDLPGMIRLAIPLMDDFKGYDRVVWVDADVDVLSPSFAGIMEVETSDDGLAAAPDINQKIFSDSIRMRFPDFAGTYFNGGVLVMDLKKINKTEWRKKIKAALVEHASNPFRHNAQDILNGHFSIKEMDARYNWIWRRGVAKKSGALCVHYCDYAGHDALDGLLSMREEMQPAACSVKERCVVVSPRHDFIRPWIRAYFASGNTMPLVIVPGPPGDWRDDDMEYCQAAAKSCGGVVFDCSKEWAASRRLASRAVRANKVGWYSKKSILHAVASRISPKIWAWIDDDAEITDSLDECFTFAENAPGFICAQFYRPDTVDIQHPVGMYRSKIDTGDKLCWNSLVLFHGDANKHLTEELCKDFPVEDDEIVFGHLYQTNKVWHDGFCDFSARRWQMNCKLIEQIPAQWSGKLLHYTSHYRGGEVKKMWASKVHKLPKAPFEIKESFAVAKEHDDGAIDAVFIIGEGANGSAHANEELRYALRNLEKHCPFVRDVYICGFCPAWVDKSKVHYLQWPDRFDHAKDANIIDKLRHACETDGIAKRILFCSDDQFQTRVCTWEDFEPRYLKRYQSNDMWYSDKNRIWHDRLRSTLEREVQRRKNLGLDATNVFYYQPHIWMPIDRDKFLEYAKWSGYAHRDDTIIASGYYNFINACGRDNFDHAFLATHDADLPSATHVAYHDGSYRAAMAILRKMFPVRCKFEVGQSISSDKSPQPLARPAKTQVRKVDDTAPATTDEMSRILSVMSCIRKTSEWRNLLGDVTLAEELRLFGVHGWRIVWNDIISRWSDATANGSIVVPVTADRSEGAERIIGMYTEDPEAMRTITYGKSVLKATRSKPSATVIRQLPRPQQDQSKAMALDRVRSALRNRV